MRFPMFFALSSLSGCLALDPDPTLTRFADCDAMKDYMVDVGLREAQHHWSVNFGPIVGGFSQDMALSLEGGGSIDRGSVQDESAGQFSTTNVQELGVDEADTVKTDGTWIYSLAGQYAMITLAWPISDAREISRILIDGQPSGMYLYDDTLVVLSDLQWNPANPRSKAKIPSAQTPVSLITVVDISDRSLPVVTRETYLEGEIWGSRRIANRLFITSHLDVDIDTGGYNTSLPDARKAIRAADAQEWLPWKRDMTLVDGEWNKDVGRACECKDVWWSKRKTGTRFTNVLSMDLDDPNGSLQGQGVVGVADILYGSANAIYVAYSEVPDGPFRSIDDQLDTIIHKFDISDKKGHPEYADTVQLTGIVPDQFALSEYGGVLRVATTDEATYTTHVWTLDASKGELTRMDHLGGLAPGEELYSARFVGPIGYLVTYEVARNGLAVTDIAFGDPLFTIDLSDPNHIRSVGELVMNGWSDYIHPMGEDRLLTVGMDQASDGTWQVAVSLFDVSDLENPILADREILDAWSSEAQTDHHAFNYFAPFEVLAMPSVALNRNWVLEVLHVDRDGIESIGQMGQETVDRYADDPACARIRRSVFFDDNVWAVSEAGLTAAKIDDPEQEIKSVHFEGVNSCWWYDPYGGYGDYEY